MMKLMVGYGERVITPPLGVDLCGYGFYLDRKAESVLDDLKVRTLVLKANRTTLVLASLDLIGLSVAESDGLRLKIAESLAVPRMNILLACTHTHSGPVTQALPGLGKMDVAYMKTMRASVVSAAEEAAAALRTASMSLAFEAIEPIGFDRRSKNFCGIDPILKTAVFQTAKQKIYLFNYACHGVVLGPEKRVSADWPGAVIRAVEQQGHRAIFLQGFCGDIDSVTQMNRWGKGTEDDLAFYGDMVARRLAKAERFVEKQDSAVLKATETRVSLPLRVYTKREIVRAAASFTKLYAQFPAGRRFAEEWKATALARLEEFRKAPVMTGVPVQAMAIGGLEIVGLPGEIFTSFGLALRKRHPRLMPVGYANGSVGYIPTRRAYKDPSDYAAWCAPMFYAVFPFTPDVGARLMGASRRLLGEISRS
jgi:hypothetical protein